MTDVAVIGRCIAPGKAGGEKSDWDPFLTRDRLRERGEREREGERGRGREGERGLLGRRNLKLAWRPNQEVRLSREGRKKRRRIISRFEAISAEISPRVDPGARTRLGGASEGPSLQCVIREYF